MWGIKDPNTARKKLERMLVQQANSWSGGTPGPSMRPTGSVELDRTITAKSEWLHSQTVHVDRGQHTHNDTELSDIRE